MRSLQVFYVVAAMRDSGWWFWLPLAGKWGYEVRATGCYIGVILQWTAACWIEPDFCLVHIYTHTPCRPCRWRARSPRHQKRAGFRARRQPRTVRWLCWLPRRYRIRMFFPRQCKDRMFYPRRCTHSHALTRASSLFRFRVHSQ